MVKKPHSNDERRLFGRHALELRVAVTRSLPGSQAHCVGRSTDVSEGGMRVYIPRELEAGEVLWLEFTVNDVPFRIQARVRNRHGVQYGLQFLTLSSKQREAIRIACGMTA